MTTDECFVDMFKVFQNDLEQALQQKVQNAMEAQAQAAADAIFVKKDSELAEVVRQRDTSAGRVADLELELERLQECNEQLCVQFSALLDSLRLNFLRGHEALRVSEQVLAHCRSTRKHVGAETEKRRSRSRSPTVPKDSNPSHSSSGSIAQRKDPISRSRSRSRSRSCSSPYSLPPSPVWNSLESCPQISSRSRSPTTEIQDALTSINHVMEPEVSDITFNVESLARVSEEDREIDK